MICRPLLVARFHGVGAGSLYTAISITRTAQACKQYNRHGAVEIYLWISYVCRTKLKART
jgi:hypothetical protein